MVKIKSNLLTRKFRNTKEQKQIVFNTIKLILNKYFILAYNMVIYISKCIKNFNYLSRYLWCNVNYSHLKLVTLVKIINNQIHFK
jgi:hypothetical protein